MKLYTCICGKNFETPNSFNGHKSSCEIHLKSKGKWDEKVTRDKITALKIGASIKNINNKKREEKLVTWLNENHVCERCGEVMTEKFGSGRFCSVACANGKTQTSETKELISQRVKLSAIESGKRRRENNIRKYEADPNHCSVCSTALPYDRRMYKTCGNTDCLKTRLHEAGVKSVQKQGDTRRSQNEILFANKCKQYFTEVETNANIFSGWDADVIIHDFKIAVLWNGSWHFDKLTKQHSVEQVQNRDRLKIQAINSAGYTSYIIEDHGSFNEEFVEEQFQKLLEFINPPCPRWF